ncbi:MAG: hypothetical protein AB1486_35645 [Planctomycetota bacterium]
MSKTWRQRLERAAYEAELAARQYRLVEPENRLVARQLERGWEEKLAAKTALQEDYDRFEKAQPRTLSDAEREAIKMLAADIPALWNSPTTMNADRKEILRQVVERVVLDAQDKTERVRITIYWVGGTKTDAEMIRPVAKLSQLSYYSAMCDRVRALAGDGLSTREIAEHLNAEGFRPPKRVERFSDDRALALMHRLGLTQHRSRSKSRDGLREHEWWLPELARKTSIPEVTLYFWIRRGWIKARRQEGDRGRWILWADEAEVKRLIERSQRPRGFYTRRLWVGEAAVGRGGNGSAILANGRAMH